MLESPLHVPLAERLRAWPRSAGHAARKALRVVTTSAHPEVEPIGLLPLVALGACLFFSVRMFLHSKFPPMQDLGHHVALSAVVSDWGRPGSLYTALYEHYDPLAANSLMYTVAGYVGRVVGVVTALRGCLVFYLVGVPLANLYALRAFGRSSWGAVLAVPLVYNMNFVAGFANLLFAAPLMVAVIPAFYLALSRPSWRRTLGTSLLFGALFLAHAHAFLWTGSICFLLTLAMAGAALARPGELGGRLRATRTLLGVSLVIVLPSVLLFLRWYERTFGAGRMEGAVINATGTLDQGFGAYFQPPATRFANIAYCLKTFLPDDDDLRNAILVLAVTGVAVSCARLHRFRRPPVMELTCVVTALSFFFLPEGMKGHDVIASRQIGIAMWFLPALVTPVPWRASPFARAAVVAGILAVSAVCLRSLQAHWTSFEGDDVAGLDDVLRAAPPRLWLHYVKIDPESRHFAWRALWHVDKFYMGEKLGQVADTPGILSTSAIRYREGVEIHRVGHHAHDWPSVDEIWDNFDLILVHKWTPTAEDRRKAEAHGSLLRRSGDWELWRSNVVNRH